MFQRANNKTMHLFLLTLALCSQVMVLLHYTRNQYTIFYETIFLEENLIFEDE